MAKNAALLSALILLFHNNASATERVFYGCENTVTINNGVFSHTSDHTGNFRCEVFFWPIKNPVGLLECSNGSYVTLEQVDNDTINFSGDVMFLSTAKKDACGN